MDRKEYAREYARKRRLDPAYRERERERERARRAADPEQHRAKDRAKYAANPEAATKRQRRYREAHAEEVAERRAKWRDENRDKVKEDNAKRAAAKAAWLKADRAAHPEKYRSRVRHPHHLVAHTAVASALKHGILVRPDACSECGNAGRIEAHHADYERLLDVEWLCVPCHRQR